MKSSHSFLCWLLLQFGCPAWLSELMPQMSAWTGFWTRTAFNHGSDSSQCVSKMQPKVCLFLFGSLWRICGPGAVSFMPETLRLNNVCVLPSGPQVHQDTIMKIVTCYSAKQLHRNLVEKGQVHKVDLTSRLFIIIITSKCSLTSEVSDPRRPGAKS